MFLPKEQLINLIPLGTNKNPFLHFLENHQYGQSIHPLARIITTIIITTTTIAIQFMSKAIVYQHLIIKCKKRTLLYRWLKDMRTKDIVPLL
jgi:hypothetical protein